MNLDLREWLPDLSQYKFTFLYAAGQLALAGRARVHERHPMHAARPPADLTWFVPIYVWGLESLHHLAWWLLGSHGFCFGPPISSLFSRGFLTCLVMAATVGASFVSEQWARQNRRAARAAQATLPLPIVAAIIGVLWTWALHVLLLLPYPFTF